MKLKKIILGIINNKTIDKKSIMDIDNEILDFSILHRICPFILEYLSEHNYNNCKLYNKLLEINENLRKSTIKNILELDLLLQELNQYNIHPIYIKGVYLYLLLDDPLYLKNGDIDLIVNEEKTFTGFLISKGYIQTKEPFLNEIGEFSKNGVELDLQKYFPVYSLLLENNVQNIIVYKPKTQKIGYNDLLNNFIKVKNIHIPCLEMQLLIIISHSFLNYINMWSISYRERPCIQLCEFLVARKILLQTNFNYDTFQKILKKYSAEQVWNWFKKIMDTLFISPEDIFVQKIVCYRNIWSIFWLKTSNSIGELLDNNWFNINCICKQMNSNKLEKNSFYYLYNFHDEYLTFGKTNGKLRVKITNNYTIQIKISELENFNIRFEFGIFATEIIKRDAYIKIKGKNNLDYKMVGNTFYFNYKGNCNIKINNFFIGLSEFENNDLIYSKLIPIELNHI